MYISRDADLEPKARATLDALESYWRQLRRADRLPARTDVDPARIDAALPHVFVLDRIAAGEARIRVSGAQVGRPLGEDVRGMPLSILFQTDARPKIAALVESVFQGPSVVECPLISPRGLARPRLVARLLLLPLSDDGTGSKKALGALFTRGTVGRGAQRFAIAPGALIRCEPASGPAEAEPVAVGHLDNSARMPSVARAAPRPFLRLVVSNP